MEEGPVLSPVERMAEKIRAKIAENPNIKVEVIASNVAGERFYVVYKKMFPDHVELVSLRNPFWEPAWTGRVEDHILFIEPEASVDSR